MMAAQKESEYAVSMAYERCPYSVNRTNAATIVSGNECERFRECWHERFNINALVESSADTLTMIP